MTPVGGITINARAADVDGDVARYDWAAFSIRIAVAVIIVAQAAFLTWSVSDTWFKRDDFVLLYRTTTEGGFPGSLFTVHIGHLIPGVTGTFWILRSLFVMQWWPFVVVIVGAQAAASYLTWRVLRSFFGSRPIAVLLLLVYSASVLTFGTNMIAMSAIQYLPMQIAFPATILILQRYIKRPALGTAVGAVIPSLVALLFFQKALTVVPFVIVLCALTPLTKDSASSWIGRLREARKPLIAMTAAAIVYATSYVIFTSGSANRPKFTFERLSRFDLAPFTQNLVPSLFGGPSWFSGNGTFTSTADSETLISLILLGALFAWSIIRRWTSIKYWILLGAMTLANLALFAFANRWMTNQPRYMSDLVFPLVLLVGLAVIGNSNDLFDRPSPLAQRLFRFSTFTRRALIAVAGIALVVNSATSLTTLGRAMSPAPGKDYVETARRTARAAIETPTAITQYVSYGLFPQTTEVVLLPAELNMRFGGVVENPSMVLADGSVVPAKFDPVSQPVATGTSCLNQPYRNRTTLTMNNSPILGGWYGRLEYTATSKATLGIIWSGPKVVMEIEPGARTLFFPITGGGQTLTITLSNGGSCIHEIEIVQMRMGR